MPSSGIAVGDVDDRPVGQHFLHRVLERRPLVLAVEVVDHHEAAAPEVLAQPRGLRAVRMPRAATGLLEDEPRIVEQRVVVERDGAAILRDLRARHSRERGQEMRFGERIIDRPPRIAPAARSRAAAGRVSEPAHLELGFRWLAHPRLVGRLAAFVELRARAADQTDQADRDPHGELADAHGEYSATKGRAQPRRQGARVDRPACWLRAKPFRVRRAAPLESSGGRVVRGFVMRRSIVRQSWVAGSALLVALAAAQVRPRAFHAARAGVMDRRGRQGRSAEARAVRRHRAEPRHADRREHRRDAAVRSSRSWSRRRCSTRATTASRSRESATCCHADPEVTMHDTDRGPRSLSAKIEANPQPPLLADGLWAHTEKPTKSWETEITIPNITCDSCQLQVIEFMAEHPGVRARRVLVSPLRGAEHHGRSEQARGRRALEMTDRGAADRAARDRKPAAPLPLPRIHSRNNLQLANKQQISE